MHGKPLSPLLSHLTRITIAVTLVAPSWAQTASSTSTQVPTLGQLVDAQAQKAREDFLKSKDIKPSLPASAALPSLGPSGAAAAPSPSMPTTRQVPSPASYQVMAIYGPVRHLSAQILMDGKTHVVRSGDQIGADAWVESISGDAVTLRLRVTKAKMSKKAASTETRTLTLRPGDVRS